MIYFPQRFRLLKRGWPVGWVILFGGSYRELEAGDIRSLKSYCKRKRKRSDSVIWQTPLYLQKNPKSIVTTQKVTKNFDYTTITDWLRMVSWSNNSHPTGVVKPVSDKTLVRTWPVRLVSHTFVYLNKNSYQGRQSFRKHVENCYFKMWKCTWSR